MRPAETVATLRKFYQDLPLFYNTTLWCCEWIDQAKGDLSMLSAHLEIYPERQELVFLQAIKQAKWSAVWSIYQAVNPTQRLKFFGILLGKNISGLADLRKCRKGPRLDQAHLNQQMAWFAHQIKDYSLQKSILAQGGFCFAWSHSEATLRALGRRAWWERAKLYLSIWPRDASSLKKNVTLPESATPRSLEDLFRFMVSSQVVTQEVESSASCTSSPTIFQPQKSGAAPKWQSISPDQADAFFQRLEFRTQGAFTLENLKAILTSEQVQALEKTGYVLVENATHAIHYQAVKDENSRTRYVVFDSNDEFGPLDYSRLSLAIGRILEIQGSALRLEGVRVIASSEALDSGGRASFGSQSRQLADLVPKHDGSLPGLLAIVARSKTYAEAEDLVMRACPISEQSWKQCFSIDYRAKDGVNILTLSAPFLLHAVVRGRRDLVNLAISNGAKPALISAVLKLVGPLTEGFFENLHSILAELFKKFDLAQQSLVLRGWVELVQSHSATDSEVLTHACKFIGEHLKPEHFSSASVTFFKNVVLKARENQQAALERWYELTNPRSDQKPSFALARTPSR